MLAKRIIPCLDVKDGKVVKGIRFTNLRFEGDPAEMGCLYEREGADEIVFLDITASFERRDILLEAVKKTAEEMSIPLTVGGGLRTKEDIKHVLKAGADKISINTAAVRQPSLVKEASDAFGSQCVVVAIDAKRHVEIRDEQKWEVYVEGGRVPTGIDAVSWAKQAEQFGAGEILLTSMDMDGTQEGYDVDLTRTVTSTVAVPVIASGGAGNADHILHVIREGQADAALAASIFHDGIYSVREVKQYLKEKGVPVRE